jgi:C1A family cysteine protease
VRGKGLALRDYSEHPEFSGYSQFTDRIPRNEWVSRVEYLNETNSQPYHWHKAYCPIKNQGSTSLCWMFGLVSGVENRLAAAGTPVELNPYATAYKARGTDRKGGFGLEAAKIVNEIGCPSTKTSPGFKKTQRWDKETTKDANRHKIAEFHELGKDDLDGAISALLSGYPCTLAISSWRHLVLGVGVVRGRDWGVIFANSWGKRFAKGGMRDGYGVLWGKNAVPYESIVIKHAKARSES